MNRWAGVTMFDSNRDNFDRVNATLIKTLAAEVPALFSHRFNDPPRLSCMAAANHLIRHPRHLPVTWYQSPDLVITGSGVIRDPFRESGTAGAAPTWERFEAAYRDAGEDFLSRLRGYFALLLWDRRRSTGYLLRDPLGLRPAYYLRSRNRLAFASDISLLLPLLERRELSPEGVASYCHFGYTPAPFTLLEGVHKLFPGEWIKFDAAGNVRRHRYWHIPPYQPEERPLDDFAEEIRAVLEAIIRDHTVEGARQGIWLSGGIDSTVLAGLHSRAAETPPATLTFGIDIPHPRADYMLDIRYARIVAEHYRLPWQSFIIERNFPLGAYLRRALANFSDLVLSPNMVTKYYFSEQSARLGFDTIMTGSNVGGVLESPRPEKVADFYDPALSDGANMLRMKNRFMKLPETHRLFPFTRSVTEEHLAALMEPFFEGVQGEDPGDRLNGVLLLLQGAEKGVQMAIKSGRAFGIDNTAPFCDDRLLQIAVRVPPRLKTGGNEAELKRLLKRACADLLPQEIVQRKVRGYPSYYWAEPIEEIRRQLLQTRGSDSALPLDLPYLETLLEAEANSPKKSAGKRRWGVTVFWLWYNRYLLGEAEFPQADPHLAANE